MLQWLKNNLKMDEIILRVDFANNHDNKRRDEIRSTYFGHENFTIFTATCYFQVSINVENTKIDDENNLVCLTLSSS